MRLKMDEEKLKQLDEYNLFRILEKASLGNLVRCSVGVVNKLADIWDGLCERTEEELEAKKKEERDKTTD